MNSITSLRLENRILLAEGREHDIIELSKKYNIPVVLSTDGNYESGPYIERIYKKTSEQLSIDQFKEFVSELIPMTDMYRGVRNFTFAEFSIKILIEKNGIVLETPVRSCVVVYMDIETDQFVMTTIDPEQEKIRHLSAWNQARMTREAYNSSKNNILVSVSV